MIIGVPHYKHWLMSGCVGIIISARLFQNFVLFYCLLPTYSFSPARQYILARCRFRTSYLHTYITSFHYNIIVCRCALILRNNQPQEEDDNHRCFT